MGQTAVTGFGGSGFRRRLRTSSKMMRAKRPMTARPPTATPTISLMEMPAMVGEAVELWLPVGEETTVFEPDAVEPPLWKPDDDAASPAESVAVGKKLDVSVRTTAIMERPSVSPLYLVSSDIGVEMLLAPQA
jgi:hypothetical protein